MGKKVAQKKHRVSKQRIENVASLERTIELAVQTTARSFRESVDLRWDRMEERFTGVDDRFDRFKGYFEGLVSMVIAQNTRIDKVLLRLEDRSRRINVYESRN